MLVWLTLGLTAVFIIAANTETVPTIEQEIQEEVIAMPLKELNKELTNEMSMVAELEGLDRRIEKYLTRWHIKGASLAITRNDSLVYAKGYGWAEEEKEIKNRD